MIRPAVQPSGSLYAADYAVGQAIKAIADERGLAFIVATHTRKAEAEDPLDTVNATAGLAGAADTTLVLRREIGRADASLYVRGRDVPEGDHALSFEAVTCQWSLLGDAAEYRLTEGRAEVVKLLRTADAPLSPKEIADALGGNRGTVRVLLHRMAATDQVINHNGRYTLPPTYIPVTPVTSETFVPKNLLHPVDAGVTEIVPKVTNVTPVTGVEQWNDKWTR